MLLAQALIPIAAVVAVAAAVVCALAARDPAVPRPAAWGPALVELALAHVAAGLAGTIALAAFVGGYAGELDRAAWAGGAFLAGFAALAVASLLAAPIDADDGRPAVVAPFASAALALSAGAGLFGLASRVAGEGPWAAASLIAPFAGGAGLAALVAALGPAPGASRPAAGPLAGGAVAAAALAGLLASGELSALYGDAAWSAFPLVVAACVLAAAAIASIPGAVLAASGRSAAPLLAAWLAAIIGALAVVGAAIVLLPAGAGWAAGAAGAGLAAGLVLAHAGILPATGADRLPGRLLPWVAAALALAVAWALGRELSSEGFAPAAAGLYGLALAAGAAAGPVVARLALVPFAPPVPAAAIDVETWARPGEAGFAVAVAAAPARPRPANAVPAAGIAALAAVVLALTLGPHARHELLRTAEADPVRTAAIVQDLGLLPTGAADRYAFANDLQQRRTVLEELRQEIQDDADFGPADVRLLLAADASARDTFVQSRLAAGQLIPGEAARVSAARRPLPALLPLPGASAGAAVGLLAGFAVIAAAGFSWRPGTAAASLAAAFGLLALLLAVGPALRFFGPGEADPLALVAALALVAGPGAALMARDETPGAAPACGLAAAGLALAVTAGLLA
jgi:Meckel syndrome type 1 protein